jgi:hypothetical protein
MEEGERLPVGVAQDETGGRFLDGLGWNGLGREHRNFSTLPSFARVQS